MKQGIQVCVRYEIVH